MKEDVGRRCAEHLETLRVTLPRAYFLSNDEVYELLSTKTVEGVRPHLPKLLPHRLFRSERLSCGCKFRTVSV